MSDFLSEFKPLCSVLEHPGVSVSGAEHMVPKHSQSFLQTHPDWGHNFMDNKGVVADDTIVTGSFNFSSNAMKHAENVLCFTEPKLAKAYADYIDGLVARYGSA